MFQLTSILRATWILIDFNEDLYSNKLESQRLYDYFTEVPLYKIYLQTLIWNGYIGPRLKFLDSMESWGPDLQVVVKKCSI